MINQKEILQKLETLKKFYDAGKIPKLHEHEINPGLPKGSRENYLYFIMTCCLNYQRSSPKAWQSALATWEDSDTNFLFFPEKVVEKTEEEMRTALLKHKLGLQPVKHVGIWMTISQTFFEHFDSDPRNLFKQASFDVENILQIIQKDLKKSFPYLSGPKLSNYFLFILLHYTNLQLKNTDKISIIPDTHIMQATQQLGILVKEEITTENVEEAWRKLLEGTKYTPIDFHSMLWNWSRNKFQPEV